MAESDKAFLEYVVRAIVDHPDEVVVERKVDERGVLLTLKVNARDMGQIVGRDGTTAKSIRALLRIVGIRNNARVNLRIDEPPGSTRPQRPPREHREYDDRQGPRDSRPPREPRE